jgi:hypothetical protein
MQSFSLILSTGIILFDRNMFLQQQQQQHTGLATTELYIPQNGLLDLVVLVEIYKPIDYMNVCVCVCMCVRACACGRTILSITDHSEAVIAWKVFTEVILFD